MAKAPYEAHCPDCMVLPEQFPSSCLGPIMAALGGTIEDPRCTLHCAVTLAAWGAGLYIGADHPHPLGVRGAVADNAAAKAELEKVQASVSGGKRVAADFGAFNWKMILTAVLALIQQLLASEK